MRARARPASVALGLVLLFVLSLVPMSHDAQDFLDLDEMLNETTPLGQAEKLTIGSWPDGANQRVEVSIPDGHSIKSLDLEIGAATLTSSMASVLTDVGDFDGNAVYDGMDVNKSSLQILPQDWSYDLSLIHI